MITPRLHRRSLAKAAQWRLLFLFWAALAVPGLFVLRPVSGFLSKVLDHATVAASAVSSIDGATFVDLARQLAEDGHSVAIQLGLTSGLIVVLLCAPFVAGAVVTAARSDEPLRFPRLLAGGGELYGRMLRTTLAGLIPLGLCGAVLAGLFRAIGKANQKAVFETVASQRLRFGFIAAAALFFVFHLFVDLARAQFAADASRRSGLMALGAGVKLFFKRPLRVLGIALLGSAAAFVPAFILMAVRLRIPQASPAAMGFAWILAQLAQVSIGWGRGARLMGFSELARAHALDRMRPLAFSMEPPATTPPPVLHTDEAPFTSPAPVRPPDAPAEPAADPSPKADLSTPDGSAT